MKYKSNLIIFVTIQIFYTATSSSITSSTSIIYKHKGVLDNPTEILFILYTRISELEYNIIKLGDVVSLHESLFDPTLSTKIIIHGFQSNCRSEIFTTIKNAYLTSGEYNVICVDWSILAREFYFEAIKHTYSVGLDLAYFLDWLVVESGLDFYDMHIIGHSLGAHVAGVAGGNTRHGIVQIITGLDPAVPFISMEPEKTLDYTDAVIVEIIFTSILSYGHPLGHINYVVNKGTNQPGCIRNYKTYGTINKRDIISSGEIICSHSKAYVYFSEAIMFPFAFPAKACKTISNAIDETNCSFNANELYFMFNGDFMRFGIYSIKTI